MYVIMYSANEGQLEQIADHPQTEDSIFSRNWFYKKLAYFKNSDFRQIIQN